VPNKWRPFEKGRWSPPASGSSPVWIGDLAWETEASSRGNWVRAATYGWVWVPPDSSKGERKSRPGASVVFVRVESPRPLIAWIPVGPRDDVRRIEMLERSRGELGQVRLENYRGKETVRAMAEKDWPNGTIESLPSIGKASRFVDPQTLGRR